MDIQNFAIGIPKINVNIYQYSINTLLLALSVIQNTLENLYL